MKKILIISFSDLRNDPRVNRQIRFLKNCYEITALGLNDPQLPGVRFIPIEKQFHSKPAKLIRAAAYKLGRFEQIYWSLYQYDRPLAALAENHFDLIIANDLGALPLGLRIAHGAKVMLDAHEYTPSQFEDRWKWNFFFREFSIYLCRTYLPRCDRVITVSAGIAAAYQNNFGVPVQVITNSSDFFDLSPALPDPTRIRLIHHGNANPSRGLETMVQMMDQAGPDLTLDLLLVKTFPRYHRKLMKKAAHNPRIAFPEPLPMADIVPFINHYDVGLCFFKPVTFNLLHVLPNKFFEFIQARLAILSGPSPEMADIIRHYDCGVVAADFSLAALTSALSSMNRQKIEYFKHQSHRAAQELSADSNQRRLLALVRELIGG
jgi:hypothetical protein